MITDINKQIYLIYHNKVKSYYTKLYDDTGNKYKISKDLKTELNKEPLNGLI